MIVSEVLEYIRTICISFSFISHNISFGMIVIGYSFDPQRQKMYLRTCAPSRDSDQPANSRSLIGIFFGRSFGAKFLHKDNKESNQTARTVPSNRSKAVAL